MVAGIIIGTMLVNHAVRSPSISIARERPTSPDEDLDIDHHLPRPDDEPMDEWYGMTQVTAAAVFLGVSIGVGIALLEIFRLTFNVVGSDFFDKFSLFPFAIIGGRRGALHPSSMGRYSAAASSEGGDRRQHHRDGQPARARASPSRGMARRRSAASLRSASDTPRAAPASGRRQRDRRVLSTPRYPHRTAHATMDGAMRATK